MRLLRANWTAYFGRSSRKGKKEKLGGKLRIAAYSAVMHPVVTVALAPLLREYPLIEPEFVVKEVKEIPELLHRSIVDLVLVDFTIDKKNYDRA